MSKKALVVEDDVNIAELLMLYLEKNAESAKVNLKKLGIRIVAEDTGLNYGRTIEFYSEDGSLLIKAVGKEQKRI